jgi:hypothetical protein
MLLQLTTGVMPLWGIAQHPQGCSSRAGLVGGTRSRRFAGTSFKPHKLLKNAPTPTTVALAPFAGDRVHVEDIVPAGYPARRGCVRRTL